MKSLRAGAQPGRSGRSANAVSAFPAWLTLPGLALFILVFAYVRLRLEPAAEFFVSGPSFSMTADFTQPGGLAEYAGTLLVQADRFGWLGALLFAFLTCSAWLLSRLLVQSWLGPVHTRDARQPERSEEGTEASSESPAQGEALFGWGVNSNWRQWCMEVGSWGPAVFLLLARNRESLLGLKLGLGWLLSLSLALILNSFTGAGERRQARVGLRSGLCALAILALFYVAGPWPSLLLAALVARGKAGAWLKGNGESSAVEPVEDPEPGGQVGVSRFADGRAHWIVALGCVLAGVAGPVWLLNFRHADFAGLLQPWSYGPPLLVAVALYFWLPLVSLVPVFVRSGVSTAVPAPTPTEGRPQAHRRSRKPDREKIFKVTVGQSVAVGLVLAGAGAVWLTCDGGRRSAERLEYYAYLGMDSEAIASAARVPVLRPHSAVRLDLALYRAGRLGEDLFAFTNRATWQMLPGLSQGYRACRPQSEVLLELGQVSEAEHLAHEALECEGDRPDTLRLLAKVNVLKGRPKAARVFLNRLAQIPFERAGARRRLSDLEEDPALSQDPELGGIRSRMVQTDWVHAETQVEPLLRQLLTANPTNRMAFEYLAAHYLMTFDLKAFVAHLGRLDSFRYEHLPRHWEEALLLHRQMENTTVDPNRVRQETAARFDRWVDALRRGALDTPQGRAALARDYGDTYWQYHLTRRKLTLQASL